MCRLKAGKEVAMSGSHGRLVGPAEATGEEGRALLGLTKVYEFENTSAAADEIRKAELPCCHWNLLLRVFATFVTEGRWGRPKVVLCDRAVIPPVRAAPGGAAAKTAAAGAERLQVEAVEPPAMLGLVVK